MATIPRHVFREAAKRRDAQAAADAETSQRQTDAYDRWSAAASPADLIEMEMGAIQLQTHLAQQARLSDARQQRKRR
jgi:hypothetical protein